MHCAQLSFSRLKLDIPSNNGRIDGEAQEASSLPRNYPGFQ